MIMNNDLFLMKNIDSTFALYIILVIFIVVTIAQWILFKKAGEFGWKSLIPIYSLYIYITKIARKHPMCFWFPTLSSLGILILLNFYKIQDGYINSFTMNLIAFFIFVSGILNLIIYSLVTISISRNFGHGLVYALGLIFFPYIFLIILAFGNSKFNPTNETYYI